MMDLNSAIQHCEEVADEKEEDAILYHNCATYNQNLYEKGLAENTEKECRACAEEHRQLAEWLKELKEYREQRGQRMNKVEKERLIKKDIESVENRVRHAFNQGYEMGLKERSSENPNTCGDAISREELIEALDTWDKFGYAPTNELIPLRGNADKNKYVPYIHYDDVIKCIKGMPSVTPEPCEDAISRQAVLDLAEWFDLNRQHFIVANLIDEVENMPSVSPQQRTGRWIEVLDKIRAEIELIKEAEYQIYGKGSWRFVDKCLDIIDKYKAESEDKE